MSPPAEEPPLDTTLAHHLEGRALQLAGEKARSEAERRTVEALAQRREALMRQRAAHHALLTERRHARGEVYSAARVRAINALGPGLAELEDQARDLYASQPDAVAVLKAHARVHFGQALAFRRMALAHATPDIVDELRRQAALEDAFAAAWVQAIGDRDFSAEVAARARAALTLTRDASAELFLVGQPPLDDVAAADAGVLGRAWSRLDALATARGLTPLSSFIGLEGQAPEDDADPAEVLATVEALLAALSDAATQLPARKATREALVAVAEALRTQRARGGRVRFELDL